ncbi:MAG: hypothetical protein V4689_22940 [Verrucomicrobiota bacterium]
MNRSIITMMSICLTQGAIADSGPYSGHHEVLATNGSLTVRHTHDWNWQKVDVLIPDSSHNEKIFTSANDFASTEFRDGSKVLFKSPSPALTHVWISPDGQFVVGLSDVMLRNPYQLVIWRKDGSLLHREHISAEVAKLTLEQRKDFALKFPDAEKLLTSRYLSQRGVLYLDFSGVYNEIGKAAWKFLDSHRSPHPYSDDFTESVTNSVYWFDPKKPDIGLTQKEGEFTLTLRSPMGKPMMINFKP